MVAIAPAKKTNLKESLLTPRFYTTNFDVVANLDLSAQSDELQAMLTEMRADYNRHHFVRDAEFDRSWEHLDLQTRQAFIDYLERSCVSEFSGFLLFKELSRKLKDRSPVLAEIFQLMARDEARHAGFLNKAMGDFDRTLDLGYLTKARTYTFFPIEWIIYTVYLSEKIGYWRYILIFRHLQKHPDQQFYPLFRYFDSWCQDENRHGDIFKALLRSQPQLLNTWQSRLWMRFFLLMVFVTHSLTVYERADFYHSFGFDHRQFDRSVIRETNKTAAAAFSVVLDTERPDFYPKIQRCAELNLQIIKIGESNQPKPIKFLRQLPLRLAILWQIMRLYFMSPIDAQSQWATVR
jgi:magnesium-protoporphyrin IX monomethyl ester (oxidative) cyclase